MPLNSPTGDIQAGEKTGTLYVVATPIGNREDITLRAIRVLGSVDLVAAEDTRHTGKLLEYLEIKNNLISCYEHNEAEKAPELIHKLRSGKSIALVSNAGTPTVSDPGYRLIKAAIEKNIRVVPVPGASAVISALSVSGMPIDAFTFAGFASRKKGKRKSRLEALAHETETLIFYESPKRALKLIDEIISVMGDRYAVLAREITKLHEEFIRGTLSGIKKNLENRPSIKGEMTLLVSGFEKDTVDNEIDVYDELKKRLADGNMKLTDIVKQLTIETGLPRKQIYNTAIEIRKKG
ncbi:MAG: 16S rRNA (cytidine(1402)-2'-O)-methyltransferase [Desulfobacterales bacterium]|nr:16S rRNA (cytidine(1402)-2'-O)-methyltransferase [Desulfobacterales bacterium]